MITVYFGEIIQIKISNRKRYVEQGARKIKYRELLVVLSSGVV